METVMSNAGLELDWNLVRTFVSVAESGSLSAAALELRASHPTIARHIQLLESRLDLSLFERTSGGLKINEAGRRLFEVARRMREDAMTFASVSAAARTTPAGKVRLTIAELLVDLVPGLLVTLQDFSGQIDRQIELIISSRQLNLLEGEADIAVRHIRPSQSELVARRVGGLPMGAFASAAYVREYGCLSLANAADHWFVDGLTDQSFSLNLARLGCAIPARRVVFRTDSLHAAVRAVEAGWGIAEMPVYIAEAAGLTRMLPDAPQATALEIWVVARPGVRQQMLLRLVFQQLAESLYDRFAAQPLCAAQQRRLDLQEPG
jgi:DNA-binding transcriptional LysR family regulator